MEMDFRTMAGISKFHLQDANKSNSGADQTAASLDHPANWW